MNQNYKNVFRFPWDNFPDVFIHADEMAVRGHPDYFAAKTGNSEAAYRLARQFVHPSVIQQIKDAMNSGEMTLVSAHALERDGVNAIPEALAEVIADQLQCSVEQQIVQINIVSHTRANGFARLGRQAEFDGSVDPQSNYFLVDDFVGQGGTLANLRGWILKQGAKVAGATVLTGKTYSAKLSVENTQINELTNKHGEILRRWWREYFGFDYDCLTGSEARYLIRSPSVDRIRNQIAAAVEAGSGSASQATRPLPE